MAATQSKTVVALVSAYVGHKGKSVMVVADSVWDRDDAIVKAYPAFFGLPPAEPIIEQATAAPGEKRGA